MRKLTDHIVNPVNDQIEVEVMDEPGAGGACHSYLVSWPAPTDGPKDSVAPRTIPIWFQNGPIAEAGVNGLTQEVLLAIVIDRLRCFQAGPFPSAENGEALDYAQKALAALHKRTRERMARGVEGTRTV